MPQPRIRPGRVFGRTIGVKRARGRLKVRPRGRTIVVYNDRVEEPRNLLTGCVVPRVPSRVQDESARNTVAATGLAAATSGITIDPSE